MSGQSSVVSRQPSVPEVGRILCLHYVAPRDQKARRLALSHDALRAMVAKEREAGRHAGTIADAVRNADVFALTWDDAHRSLFTEALPLLRELEVPGTVFVPTAYVGTSDEFMTWDELRALRDAGWTIGSHTTRHARMSWRFYDEDTSAQRKRLDRECAESRALLEAKLGIIVRDFAYPYGETTPDAIAAVKSAGYERAVTVRDSLAWDGDLLTVPRLDGMEAHGLMRARSTEPTRISVVVPACDRHEMLTEIVARWSAQSYPSEAFEVIVVDDGSRCSLRPCFEKASPNVRLVESPGSDATFRAGQTRQRGASLAKFDTLAFLDADIAVSDDFLWHLDWIHQRVDDAVVLGYLSGYNLHDIGFTHPIDSIRGGRDPEKTLAIIPDRSREPTLRGCLDNTDWLAEPWRLAYTGNLSLTKRALDAIDGFATAFSGWGLEDLDLGYRLHRAGFPFVFSRFAVGYHLVDANEGAPRNPFRAPNPTRDRFAGYEKNLATLAALHPDDAAITQFVASAHADIEETCGKPDTIGVEFGGITELECAFHRRTNKTQPGGLDEHELLDRLAYAVKVGARALYLLGGDPALHPSFLSFLEAAKRAGIRRIMSETQALPFARDGFARAARRAGLDHAIVEVFTFDAATYDIVTNAPSKQASRLYVGDGRPAGERGDSRNVDPPRASSAVRAPERSEAASDVERASLLAGGNAIVDARAIAASPVRGESRFADFEAALDGLRDAGIHRSAKITVTPQTIAHLAETLASLKQREIPIDEVVALDEALLRASEPVLRASERTEIPLRLPRS